VESFLANATNYWWLGIILLTLIVLVSAKKLSEFFGSKTIKVNAKQAFELIIERQAILIDLAEKQVYEKSHIPCAISMPGISFIDGTAKLEDTSKPVILLPMKGLFPMPVVQFIYSEGVEELYLFKGGLHEWKEAELPMLEQFSSAPQ